MVLADPEGSILRDYVETGSFGEERAAGSSRASARTSSRPTPQMDLVDKAYSISDRESVGTARELLRKEGILAGSSSGCLLAAALR
ncbi:hypothetical protein ACRAWD_07955 [Caulobacter segnis]